jgi:hypothetical protein
MALGEELQQRQWGRVGLEVDWILPFFELPTNVRFICSPEK